MKDFKGTAGPWQVVDTYNDYNETGPQIIIWNGDEQAHKPICDMGEMGDMNYAEDLANANLIAAAPDMAAALQEIILLANSRGPEPAKYGMIIRVAEGTLDKAFGVKNKLKGADNA